VVSENKRSMRGQIWPSRYEPLLGMLGLPEQGSVAQVAHRSAAAQSSNANTQLTRTDCQVIDFT
jgi:hypothetical protein